MLNLSDVSCLKGFRFPRSVIGYAVWAYHRFALGLRDVEDLFVECHRELTQYAPKLSLRIDPCEHTSPTLLFGEIWSDQHGIFKCYQTLGIA
jgi:hypothetical protein